MQQQRLIERDDTPWTVEYCGETYWINRDKRTGIHPPEWYVQRKSDLRTSKRYYSRPGGAMNALASGSIVWVD